MKNKTPCLHFSGSPQLLRPCLRVALGSPEERLRDSAVTMATARVPGPPAWRWVGKVWETGRGPPGGLPRHVLSPGQPHVGAEGTRGDGPRPSCLHSVFTWRVRWGEAGSLIYTSERKEGNFLLGRWRSEEPCAASSPLTRGPAA